MYAVVEISSHQYLVQVGDVIKTEKVTGTPGSKVEFNKVVMFSNEDKVLFGKDLATVKVCGEIVRTEKDKKIIIIKFKRRKDYYRKQGHRQLFTEIKITEIVH